MRYKIIKVEKNSGDFNQGTVNMTLIVSNLLH